MVDNNNSAVEHPMRAVPEIRVSPSLRFPNNSHTVSKEVPFVQNDHLLVISIILPKYSKQICLNSPWSWPSADHMYWLQVFRMGGRPEPIKRGHRFLKNVREILELNNDTYITLNSYYG